MCLSRQEVAICQLRRQGYDLSKLTLDILPKMLKTVRCRLMHVWRRAGGNCTGVTQSSGCLDCLKPLEVTFVTGEVR